MHGGREERIEKLCDRVAAAVLSAAVSGALALLLAGKVAVPQLAVAAAAAGLVAFLAAARLLRSVGREPQHFRLANFDWPELAFDQWDELLLTEQVELLLTARVTPARSVADELALDDILARLGENSRVVRLFDPAATPTPGQLNARIEHHLRRDSARAASQDASQALFDALTQLRASLR